MWGGVDLKVKRKLRQIIILNDEKLWTISKRRLKIKRPCFHIDHMKRRSKSKTILGGAPFFSNQVYIKYLQTYFQFCVNILNRSFREILGFLGLIFIIFYITYIFSTLIHLIYLHVIGVLYLLCPFSLGNYFTFKIMVMIFNINRI